MVMLGLLVLIAMRSKDGKVVSMTDSIKVWRYFQGLTIEANNFAFEVKVILSLESNLLKSWDTWLDKRTEKARYWSSCQLKNIENLVFSQLNTYSKALIHTLYCKNEAFDKYMSIRYAWSG